MVFVLGVADFHPKRIKNPSWSFKAQSKKKPSKATKLQSALVIHRIRTNGAFLSHRAAPSHHFWSGFSLTKTIHFRNFWATSILGNPQICGIFHSPPLASIPVPGALRVPLPMTPADGKHRFLGSKDKFQHLPMSSDILHHWNHCFSSV